MCGIQGSNILGLLTNFDDDVSHFRSTDIPVLRFSYGRENSTQVGIDYSCRQLRIYVCVFVCVCVYVCVFVCMYVCIYVYTTESA